VDPTEPSVSVKSIGIKRGLTLPDYPFLYIKSMLLAPPRGTTMDTGWYHRLFSDPQGVASYFRKMSGGRQFVEWQVFGPINIMTWKEKKYLDAQEMLTGTKKVIHEGFRNAAAAVGIPVTAFDQFIFVIDDNNISAAGATGKPDEIQDTLAAARDIDPTLLFHEMGHAFGLHHADGTQLNDYGDPYCVMGGQLMGVEFRPFVFENPRLTVPVGSRKGGLPPKDTGIHSATGTGICAPYLNQIGWLDSSTNVNYISFDGSGRALGDLEGSIYANQGGPPVGSPKQIALVIRPPTSIPFNGSEYWIEYRIPQGFDAKTFKPPGNGYGPGALLLREVVENKRSYYYSYPTLIKKGNVVRLPKLSQVIRITDFKPSTHEEEVFYSFK
jgi:hypothetical protein